MDKVRFGIIGLGNMGTAHSKTLTEGKVPSAVLLAICDRDPVRLEYAKKNLPGVTLFSDAGEMMKSGLIDAVIISTPHYDHPPLSIAAMNLGIHVMCEKPAGVYTKQVREMNQIAEESAKRGIVFAIMFNQRTNCVYRKMKEMIENGELGEIKRTNWIITNWYRPQAYYDSGGWRATWSGEGGGVLLNQCPHNLDLWQWICGMPVRVTAFCNEGKWHDIEVEDDVTAYVEYENGATGVFVTTTGDTPGTNRFEITGDKGKLVCDENNLVFTKLQVPETEFSKTNQIPFGKPENVTVEVETDGQNPQHTGVLTAFTKKILGTGELIANGTEGIHGLELSNAMHLSSWLKKPVELPLDDDLFYEELEKRIKTSRRKETKESGVVADLGGTY